MDEPVTLPNGPAKLTTDLKKDRFRLEYAGDAIFQGSVKLVRGEDELTMKDAGARLFVVSKSEGWDVVTQSIRVTAVAVLPGDTISFAGHTLRDDAGLTIDDDGTIYHQSQDWRLNLDSPIDGQIAFEDVPVRRRQSSDAPSQSVGQPGETRRRIGVVAAGTEIVLKFRPLYRARHMK